MHSYFYFKTRIEALFISSNHTNTLPSKIYAAVFRHSHLISFSHLLGFSKTKRITENPSLFLFHNSPKRQKEKLGKISQKNFPSVKRFNEKGIAAVTGTVSEILDSRNGIMHLGLSVTMQEDSIKIIIGAVGSDKVP